MSKLTPTQEAALAVLAKLESVQPMFDAVNRGLRTLCSDFYPHQTPIADCVHGEVVALLDATIGAESLASYFLYECRRDGGAVHELDGTVWPIRSVGDVRAYLEHLADQCPPPTPQ